MRTAGCFRLRSSFGKLPAAARVLSHGSNCRLCLRQLMGGLLRVGRKRSLHQRRESAPEFQHGPNHDRLLSLMAPVFPQPRSRDRNYAVVPAHPQRQRSLRGLSMARKKRRSQRMSSNSLPSLKLYELPMPLGLHYELCPLKGSVDSPLAWCGST